MRSELTLCESTNSCGLNVAVKSMCSHVLICFDIVTVYTHGAEPSPTERERYIYAISMHMGHGPLFHLSYVFHVAASTLRPAKSEGRIP